MLKTSSEPQNPADWFLIACDGDLVIKLAHDLNIGEDANGELLVNATPDEASLAIFVEDDKLTLKVRALDMTLSVAGGMSVQHVSIDRKGAIRVRLPTNVLSLSTSFVAGGREPEYLDITLIRAAQPSITRSRVSITDMPVVDEASSAEAYAALIATEAEAEQIAAASAPEAVAAEATGNGPGTVPDLAAPIGPLPETAAGGSATPRRRRFWLWLLLFLVAGLAAALLPLNLTP